MNYESENPRERAMYVLLRRREVQREMYACFFLGKQLVLGSMRVYKTKGALSARLNDYILRNGRLRDTNEAKAIVQELKDVGILEIRSISDNSAKFPYNIKGLDIEQAKKIETMTLSTDKEMIDLAVNILEGIKNM